MKTKHPFKDKRFGSRKETFGSNVSTTIIILMIFFALSPAPSAFCQVPQGFNYQALVRDGAGEIMDDSEIAVRIDIETAASTLIYREEHASVRTDSYGLMKLVVGSGTPAGGSAGIFSKIDWKAEPLYIRTWVNTGSGYADLDATQLWSVPYAMVADSLGGPLNKLSVTGITSDMEDPLFEVKNISGQTVFAVYNEGVRVFVGDGDAKGVKGGFAIGGFGSDKDENDKRYLFVDDDSVRVYINDSGKSVKGGFAIGGYGATKGWSKYMKVTSDSTRIITTDNEQGFGVGSGSTGSYLRLTPQNYFIGHGAGKSINGGEFNSFLGYEAGKLTESGSENIFVGYQSGFNNILGQWNTFLGYQAGLNNTGSDNTFIGNKAGYAHQGQGGNVYIGSKAGENATNGQQNVLIGESVGASITDGSFNVMLGYEAGNSNENGSQNVFLGYMTGHSNTSGEKNIMIGSSAGLNNISGKNNVILGVEAGHENISGEENIFMGSDAGFSNTLGCYNVFLGYNAGFNNIGSGPSLYPGNYNVFIGNSSGFNNTEGQSNVFIGNLSGINNTTGVYNTYIGRNAGGQIKEGNYNVFLGAQAGDSKKRGNNNVFIGDQAGSKNEKGSGNIFIGYRAGKEEQDSSILYIENSESTTPLIGGDFDADKVAINGKPDAAGATLQVNGSLRVGINGSNVNRILRASGGITVPLLLSGNSSVQTLAVANASTSSSVMVSPSTELPDGLIIAYARVSASGTVEIKFTNASDGSIPADTYNFYLTIIN